MEDVFLKYQIPSWFNNKELDWHKIICQCYFSQLIGPRSANNLTCSHPILLSAIRKNFAVHMALAEWILMETLLPPLFTLRIKPGQKFRKCSLSATLSEIESYLFIKMIKWWKLQSLKSKNTFQVNYHSRIHRQNPPPLYLYLLTFRLGRKHLIAMMTCLMYNIMLICRNNHLLTPY